MDSIRHIVHALETGSCAAQKSVGLSSAQLFVLQILAKGEAMSVNQLADATCTHQSSVSVVVSRLVKVGLVERKTSSTDARCLQLRVTEAGRDLLRSDLVMPQSVLLAALSSMPGIKLRQLRELLDGVVTAAGMNTRVPPMFLEKTAKG